MGAVADIFKAPPPGPPVATPPSGTYPSVNMQLPMVAVIGLSNGVGATTLTVNLGLALMQYGRSCIVDLNNRMGQVAVQLGVAPRGTWLNLIQFKPGSDKRLIGPSLTMDHPSGVAIVAAPSTPVTERLTGSALFNTLSVLSEGFSRLVVDLPADLDATTIATLNSADHIVLVVSNDPATLGNVPNALGAIEAMRIPGQIHVVLNHSRPHGVTYEQVMEAVNQPLTADVPYELAQVEALTTGQPLVMSQPASLFSRAVLHLARQM
jgi:MinD-like ATPase involved in chromosome partitioning or flagellar assembly